MAQRPQFRVFVDGIAALCPPNSDRILPKIPARGAARLRPAKLEFRLPFLGNLDPGVPEVGHMGVGVLMSNFTGAIFHRNLFLSGRT